MVFQVADVGRCAARSRICHRWPWNTSSLSSAMKLPPSLNRQALSPSRLPMPLPSVLPSVLPCSRAPYPHLPRICEIIRKRGFRATSPSSVPVSTRHVSQSSSTRLSQTPRSPRVPHHGRAFEILWWLDANRLTRGSSDPVHWLWYHDAVTCALCPQCTCRTDPVA